MKIFEEDIAMKYAAFILCFGLLFNAIGVPLLYSQIPTYTGSQLCQGCHSGLYGKSYLTWQQTLHSKIHLVPDATTVKGDFSQTASMGASYGNAQVILRTDGGKYYAKVGASGTEYEIAYTYGGGWKQRYLSQIGNSYYMLPIQWNPNKYLDNSSGAWVSYNPGTWFDASGNPKATTTNSFRAKSWDKNCSGCHVTGNNIQQVVTGTDTAWTSTWANNSHAENIVVGCEDCHGPGSLHPANAFNPDKKIINPAKLTDHDRRLEVCGQCHYRGASSAHTYEYAWDEINNLIYQPGNILANYITHKPGVWPDGITAKQHHQQYQEFMTSDHYSNSALKLDCMTCHGAHSINEHQLVDSLTVENDRFKVDNDDNTLCLACHAADDPFKNVLKAWVADPVTHKDHIAAEVSKHTHHSYDPLNTNNTGGSSRCSKCHLPKTAVTAKAYDIHSHTFDVIPPEKTLFYQTKGGMPNGCAVSCHRNATGNISSLGVGADATLTAWNEPTDLALADTLMHYYGPSGVWWERTITSIADKSQNDLSVPKDYGLVQNYPNPFNPSTTIRFDVIEVGQVTLKVYNTIGQEVATLVDDWVEPGAYRATFNAINLPSGIYFCRLLVNDFSAVKKMVLVK